MRGEDLGGGYDYLGNGPVATAGGPGWTVRADLSRDASAAAISFDLDPTEYGACSCGATPPVHMRTGCEACDVGFEIADALATAHTAGVLDRDVRPSNLLVTEFGQRQWLTSAWRCSSKANLLEQAKGGGLSPPLEPQRLTAQTVSVPEPST